MAVRRSRARIAWIASVIWMGVIFALSSVPGGSMPAGDYGWLGHFGVYFVLGGLYFIALKGEQRGWRVVVAAVVLASVYGVTDEFHQSFVPGRMPDPADWAMDTAGALTGAALALAVTRWRAGRSAASGTGRASDVPQ